MYKYSLNFKHTQVLLKAYYVETGFLIYTINTDYGFNYLLDIILFWIQH